MAVDDSLSGLLVLVGIIFINALLTLTYVALINAQKTTLKEMAEEGNRAAERALNLSSDATRVLASQQIVDILLRFAVAVTAAATIVPPLRDALLDRGVSVFSTDLIAYGA
jgi:putative hemolysin